MISGYEGNIGQIALNVTELFIRKENSQRRFEFCLWIGFSIGGKEKVRIIGLGW